MDGWWLSMAALGGAIAVGWRQIQGIFGYLQRALIGTVSIAAPNRYWEGLDVIGELLDGKRGYLAMGKRKFVDRSMQRYFPPGHAKQGSSMDTICVLMEHLLGTTLMTWYNNTPVLLRIRSPVRLQCWYIRGTLDPVELVKDWLRRRGLEKNGFLTYHTYCYFNVRTVTGSFSGHSLRMEGFENGRVTPPGSVLGTGANSQEGNLESGSEDKSEFEALDRLSSPRGPFTVARPLPPHRVEEFVMTLPKRHAETYAISPEVEKLDKLLTNFLKSASLYRKRGIAWKLGVHLTGPPGTGKTSAIRYLAMKHDLPVIVFDLTSFTSKELRKEWRLAKSSVGTPVIILLEDLDRVFCRDKPVEGVELGFTFDVLLNLIDGIELNDTGCILVVTTNDASQLDAALLRPGRLDTTTQFQPLTIQQQEQFIRRIVFGDEPVSDLQVETVRLELCADAGHLTAAEFQQRCLTRVLASLTQELASEPEEECRIERKTCPRHEDESPRRICCERR